MKNKSVRMSLKSFQLECRSKRGADIAAHSFRNLIEHDDNLQISSLINLDFSNAFIFLNRETMWNHISSNCPELYTFSHCAYSKPSYLSHENSILMSEERPQQGDPEAPPLWLKPKTE